MDNLRFLWSVTRAFLGFTVVGLLLFGVGYGVFSKSSTSHLRGDTGEIVAAPIALLFMIGTFIFPTAMPAYFLARGEWKKSVSFYFLAAICAASVILAFKVHFSYGIVWLALQLWAAVRIVRDEGRPS